MSRSEPLTSELRSDLMTESFVDRHLPGVVSRTCEERGFLYIARASHKLSREVEIYHCRGRCARHFLAYETVCYAYRSERCTVYAVPSAQVSSSCVRAFSSSFANLHLEFFVLFNEVHFNVNYIFRCYWASRELCVIDRYTNYYH